ncbi:Bromodomain containing protein [Trichomonas vaginalis G3]|uniref:Bromodomain containing protein n=1 Tax=Trichomonas vaginalis (strain ATCC PRA-98 / G3) TaxID=412133 RepID=A2E602_TRIV3|nr:acetylation-dependent protein binding [Trichomonas vaginalis G3]EAY11959.1 Bromodomain containing protein [Trichomonas vaginalis G3]KAI5530376.1 acetylation-dependent protein binding [Trichomonas vaginalis G3]|eukprot:XP_001324182.1 Bromodomain containing protein [Trichomonas vaginalis G3]
MALTDYQREKCIKLIDTLVTWEVCHPFVKMVDPELDGAPEYFTYVKEPTSLTNIKEKLTNNQYKDIDALKHDVDLIYLNSKTYNGEEAYYTLMAFEARNWFFKKIEHLPSTVEEDWLYKINKLTAKFYDAICHPPSDLDTSTKPPMVEVKQESPQPYHAKGKGKGKTQGKTISFI